MYTPAHFKVEDRPKLAAVIRGHGFATLVTTGAAGLTASHLPFLYDETAGPHGTLTAHLARANNQWREFGREVLVIFQGEHGYISPTWYATAPAVPTWNYESVHAYGVPRIVEDTAQVIAMLDAIVRTYEQPGSGYAMNTLPAGFAERMAKAIVAFEIPVTRLEGKFKMGQNRPPEDVRGAVQALEGTGDPSARRLAQAMRRENGI